MPNFVAGETFAGATGLKTGQELENLIENAVFAPSSGAVDNSTIDIDGSGRARLKDLGITGGKIATSVCGDGIHKDGSGNLEVDVDGVTLILSGGQVLVGNASGACALDGVSLEAYNDSGTMRLRVKALGINTAEIAAGAVTASKIADDSIDFSKWEVASFTTSETEPSVLAEGKLHIIYEVI